MDLSWHIKTMHAACTGNNELNDFVHHKFSMFSKLPTGLVVKCLHCFVGVFIIQLNYTIEEEIAIILLHD